MANLPAGQRLQLHSGPSRGTKLALGFFHLIGMVILVPVLALIVAALVYTLISHTAGIIVGLCLGIPLELLFIGRMLWLFRSAAWLEHTILAVRGPLTTRRCDLATASGLAFDAVAETRSIPTADGPLMVQSGRRAPRLIARDAATGKRVRLRLHDPATQLPLAPEKLAALADAIMAHPRGGPGAAQAKQVAGTLRAMASGPLAFPG